MVLNALGLTGRALYLMPEYMVNRPVDLLIGSGPQAADFNDDSLDRALEEMTLIGDDNRVCAIGTWCADIKQRWLLVRSRRAHERETKQLHAKIARQEATRQKVWRALCRRRFQCEADATAAAALFAEKSRWWTVEAKPVAVKRYHLIPSTERRLYYWSNAIYLKYGRGAPLSIPLFHRPAPLSGFWWKSRWRLLRREPRARGFDVQILGNGVQP